MTSVPTEPTTMLGIAETHLGQAPGEWINGRYAKNVSYRSIAAELAVITGVDPFVSYETIRTWHTRWVNEQIVARLDAEVNGAA